MRKLDIKHYLNENKIRYNIINHNPAYTSPEIAANAHISGKQLIKPVIVKIDGKLAMVIEPSHLRINLEMLKKLLKAKKVELANEWEFEDQFPGCETGAEPPFGNLYDIDTYIDDAILQNNQIAFNAGNHSELIQMSYDDFEQLVKPKHLRLH